MQDIKEAEVDSVADLGEFLDAELNYYDRCRDILLQLKRDWPVAYVRAYVMIARRLRNKQTYRHFEKTHKISLEHILFPHREVYRS